MNSEEIFRKVQKRMNFNLFSDAELEILRTRFQEEKKSIGNRINKLKHRSTRRNQLIVAITEELKDRNGKAAV